MSRDVLAERREIDQAVEGQTVCTLFRETCAAHGTEPALRWKAGDEWREKTWGEYADDVRAAGNGLLSLGLAPGEFANILAGNRPEYYVADLGVLHAGGTPVSLYNTLAPEQIEYIVNHCESVLVFAENAAYFERLRAIREKLPHVRHVVLFEDADKVGDDWAISYDDLLTRGRAYESEHPSALDERTRAVEPEDFCTLIYTSGTTGPPKGVMITHRNVLWTMESLLRIMPIESGMSQISYLPMAHIAERMTGFYVPMRAVTTVSFCPVPQEIGNYLAEVRPNFFFAVPRIWEKIHDKLRAALEANPDEAKRNAAKAALDACIEKVRLEQRGEPIPAELQKKVEEAEATTSFVRQIVGLDQVKVVSTGAAPISLQVLEFFHALGVRIAEVYGQSEDTGPTSWNHPDHIKIGTVGPSVPGVEVVLAGDGELLVRGGNVTQGYYKEPELTRETFDQDGWLHSGDVAVIDDDGFIKIVDRKKEILITAGGKNIAPSNVEALLKQIPLVGQACLIGEQRPYCSALIVLEPEAAAAWANARSLEPDTATLSTNAELRAEIQGAVDEMNKKLHNQEQVKKFAILPEEWTPDTGELTPTLKMKRKVVNQKYEPEIRSLYG